MAESKEKLFDQFPPVSTQEWKEKVVADLKGADFDKKLVWRTNEGFNVNPMYRAEDIANLSTTDSLPGEYPYVRGTRADNNWLVRQDIKVTDVKEANVKALDILKKGVESLGFEIAKDLISVENLDRHGECGIEFLHLHEKHSETCRNSSRLFQNDSCRFAKGIGLDSFQSV